MRNTVSYVNSNVTGDVYAFVNKCESRYKNRIAKLSKIIAADKNLKVILVAGPSASGKTTSSHILREKLLERGVKTQIISLDNFFLSRADLPLNGNGDKDFESVYSLDLKELNKCFAELIETEKCVAPVFDFHTGNRSLEKTLEIKLEENELLIVEGLHALNPLVYEALPNEKALKVFISVASSIYLDNGQTLLSGQEIRFCRRISRDNIYRNSTAQNTLNLWREVTAGEKKWIEPFKDNADFSIDTLHGYEPALFSKRVAGMLRLISRGLHDSVYVDRISDALEQFVEMPVDAVPQESLIREFVEGGKFESVT